MLVGNTKYVQNSLKTCILEMGDFFFFLYPCNLQQNAAQEKYHLKHSLDRWQNPFFVWKIFFTFFNSCNISIQNKYNFKKTIKRTVKQKKK